MLAWSLVRGPEAASESFAFLWLAPKVSRDPLRFVVVLMTDITIANHRQRLALCSSGLLSVRATSTTARVTWARPALPQSCPGAGLPME